MEVFINFYSQLAFCWETTLTLYFFYFFAILDVKKRRRRGTLVFHKKRRRLLPYIPSEDRARRLVQMGSLATALTAQSMEFSNELTYMPGMAPRSANQAKFENGGMQVYFIVKYV